MIFPLTAAGVDDPDEELEELDDDWLDPPQPLMSAAVSAPASIACSARFIVTAAEYPQVRI
jgi:hypothetical protein